MCFWKYFGFFPDISCIYDDISDMFLENDLDLEIFVRKGTIFFSPKVFSRPLRHIEQKKNRKKNSFQNTGRISMDRSRDNNQSQNTQQTDRNNTTRIVNAIDQEIDTDEQVAQIDNSRENPSSFDDGDQQNGLDTAVGPNF